MKYPQSWYDYVKKKEKEVLDWQVAHMKPKKKMPKVNTKKDFEITYQNYRM